MVAGGDRRGLSELAAELAGIAGELAVIAARCGAVPDDGGFSAGQVEALLDARHQRRAAIGLDPVHPGWTLLLVLYRAHLDGRPLRMAGLATEARVAMTTMMRWVELFVAHGLVDRRPDASRRKGVLLGLSRDGAGRVRRQLHREVLAAHGRSGTPP